jgi:hypothetical protein
MTGVEDGDKIMAEIGAYNHGTTTLTKSIIIEGVREHARLPLFVGKWVVSNVASFDIHNVEVEHSTGTAFEIYKVGKVTLAQMNVGPATTAMLIRGVDQLDITDVVFTGIQTGPKIGGTSSDIVKAVAITRSKFNGIQIGGVVIQNTDRLIVESSEFNEMCVGRSVACGLRILDSRNFMIRNSKSIGSEMGFHLESSTGSIENCEVSNTKRVWSTIGGGLYLKNSVVRTRLFTLSGNNASNGAGFYCDGGSLNMFSGKIEGNTATQAGGAGQCNNDCAFFADQVIIRDNKETAPTKCRGL